MPGLVFIYKSISFEKLARKGRIIMSFEGFKACVFPHTCWVRDVEILEMGSKVVAVRASLYYNQGLRYAHPGIP